MLDSVNPVDPVGQASVAVPIDLDRLEWHIPDPDELRVEAEQRAAEAAACLEAGIGDLREAKSAQGFNEKLNGHLGVIARPRRVEMTLSQALHRALASSYAIRVESYNPAIRTTQVVEAEAAFDAVFFGNASRSIQNVPVSTQIQGTNVQQVILDGGIRQLLATGMQVQTGLQLQRQFSDSQFQLINPVYNSQFRVEVRQPLLRGFGLDFNRAQIHVAKNDRRLSDEAFARQVQNTLRDVEQAYWRLFQARHQVAVQARLLSTFEQLYDRLEQRARFDVIPIQVNETKARLESSRAGFIRICSEVRDAEDGLIALMNDPTLDLADEIEIIPSELPTMHPVVVDRLAEVQTALDHRQEIAEAKIRVNSAKILVGAAKNQTLPQVDLLLRYAVDGLGKSADRAFDEVTKNDFHEYFVGVEFELPVGNRARRAALQRARLQHAQAIAALKQTFEQVILDVDVRTRELQTQYNLIGPNFESCEAGDAQVESIRARAETQNYIQLSNELSAIQGLAASRTDLLRSLAEYNIALIELERAKGTLLEYYGVTIPSQP